MWSESVCTRAQSVMSSAPSPVERSFVCPRWSFVDSDTHDSE